VLCLYWATCCTQVLCLYWATYCTQVLCLYWATYCTPVADSTTSCITLSRFRLKYLLTLTYFLFQTFALFWMLYDFFWAIPRRLNFICWRFGTLCLFHLHRRIDMKLLHTYLPMKMEHSVPKRRHINFRRRRNCPEESIQHTTYFLHRCVSSFRRVNDLRAPKGGGVTSVL